MQYVRRLALPLILLTIVPPVQARSSPVTVHLLAINDLHGHLEPVDGPDGSVNDVPAGGIEYLATHLQKAASADPETLFVAAGDLIGGSPFLSGHFNDTPTIESLNAMHLAISSIGNHELDNGPDEFLRRAQTMHVQYLAANVVRADAAATPLLPGTSIVTLHGVKIGFIGETLHDTDQMISRSAGKGLRFLEESSAANAAAAELERQGVHAIILLIHEGGRQKPEHGLADPNGCDHFEGELTGVLGKLSPSIKLVLSAHSHQFYNCAINGRRVISAGSYSRLFTSIALTVDPETDHILHIDARNHIVTRNVAKDPVVTAILDKYRPEAARITGRIIGSATAEIDHQENKAGESPLGDVLTDALLASTGSTPGPAPGPAQDHADIAFLNSGGIRGVIAAPPAGAAMRQVTYGDLYAIAPFGNHVETTTLTGAMIRRLLEQQFRDDGSRKILQVSAGFSYRYRADAPAGQHIVPGSIKLNGRPIAPDDAIRVASFDFLMDGGEGFTVFGEGRDPMVGGLDVDALVQYFAAHSPVAPGPCDRITRLD
jgi:5'-nucleotidase